MEPLQSGASTSWYCARKLQREEVACLSVSRDNARFADDENEDELSASVLQVGLSATQGSSKPVLREEATRADVGSHLCLNHFSQTRAEECV